MKPTRIIPINFSALSQLNLKDLSDDFSFEQKSLILLLQSLAEKNESIEKYTEAAENCAGIISIVQNTNFKESNKINHSCHSDARQSVLPELKPSITGETTSQQPDTTLSESLHPKTIKMKYLASLQALHGYFNQKASKYVLAEASYQFALKALKQIALPENTALETMVLNNLYILYQDTGKVYQSSLIFSRISKLQSKYFK
ncbi:hypothetical protein DSO57_1027348 [Entomophthora muscae]|uniref:Uncharacterized protein n=1 Tax=Entomophthora muscae TaxID=34485 RepID=A0ACC2SRI5_9FUNG|nr:hypothetical protein DSO57_1027348 [Entomophthora muscae]